VICNLLISSHPSSAQKYDPSMDLSNHTSTNGVKVSIQPPPASTTTNKRSSSLANIDPLVIHSISIQRSDSKKASDDVIFKKWFDTLESYYDTELSKWEGTMAHIIVGNEGDHAISFIRQKAKEGDVKKIDAHTKKGLNYVLDKSIGWTHGKLLWMVIQLEEILTPST